MAGSRLISAASALKPMASPSGLDRRMVSTASLYSGSVSLSSAAMIADAVRIPIARSRVTLASTFSPALVSRWRLAKTCQQDGGRPCAECRLVNDDCKAVATHVLAARHGVGSCSECAHGWELCLPGERGDWTGAD